MMINFPLEPVCQGLESSTVGLFDRTFSPEEIINSLVGYAEKARREGLLALEGDEVSEADDFLKKGSSWWWTVPTPNWSKVSWRLRSLFWRTSFGATRCSLKPGALWRRPLVWPGR